MLPKAEVRFTKKNLIVAFVLIPGRPNKELL